MKKLIRNFIIKIILLTMLIALLGGLIFYFPLKDAKFYTFAFLVILFPVISILVHIQLLKASTKSLAKFNVAFMLSFMLKLIIYAAFSGIMISADEKNKNIFVITMLLMYLIYTVFDINAILKDTKKLSEINKNDKN